MIGGDPNQSNAAVPKCSAVSAADVAGQIGVEVSEPQGGLGSNDAETCDYGSKDSDGSVQITYTPNATAATVAQAKQDATDAGYDAGDLVGIGDAGYQATISDDSNSPRHEIGAVKGGLMIEVNAPTGTAPEQTLLMELFPKLGK